MNELEKRLLEAEVDQSLKRKPRAVQAFENEQSAISGMRAQIVKAGSEGHNIVDAALSFLPGSRGGWVREALRGAASLLGVSDDEVKSHLKIAAGNGQGREVRKLQRGR